MTIKTKKSVLAVTVALCLNAVHTHAASVTYTDSVAMEHYADATASLEKFDSTLGTLTSVYIEFTTALYGADYQFDNDGLNSIDVNPSLTLDVDGYFTPELSLNGTFLLKLEYKHMLQMGTESFQLHIVPPL